MISPDTAITDFLPTVESQSVRVVDGRRPVRVARAMSQTVRTKSQEVQDMMALISIGGPYVGRILG
ncbi:hypothetical protein VR46_01765 [Streptomyces sp. NRRL S-444]|nr:hypothetical protein VR46_01765 [Streptomyces sp. NRRL S-444]